MKKKALLMLLTLLSFSMAKAKFVQIGEDTSHPSYKFPVCTLYDYSFTQQIYTAEEIGTAGTITSIAFDYAYTEPFSMNNVQMYMMHTDKQEFTVVSDYVPVTASDKVYEGTFSATGAGWATIILDTPFEYNGTDNLVVCFYDPKVAYPGIDYVFNTNQHSYYPSLSYYCDTFLPDLDNLEEFAHKMSSTYRNNIRLEINSTPEPDPDVEVIEIGDPESTDGSYTNPINTFYPYFATQQIYTAEQIGKAGTITSIAFDCIRTEPFSLENIQVYMAHTDKSVIPAGAIPIDFDASDKVYEGSFSTTGVGWATITLDTPFEYNGTDNLMICIYDPSDEHLNIYYDNIFRVTWTSPNYTSVYYGSYNSPLMLSNLRSGGDGRANKYIPNLRLSIKKAADMVEIGDDSEYLYSTYLPSAAEYRYSLSQQIYTKNEIGAARPLHSIAFYNDGYYRMRDIDIYLKHTDMTSFSDGNDWVTVTAEDKVFSGQVNFIYADWTVIPFDTPFDYNGKDNVVVVVDDNTGSQTTYLWCTTFRAEQNQSLYLFNNSSYNLDPTTTSGYTGGLLSSKNRVRFNDVVRPDGPSNVNITNVGKTSANVSWVSSGSKWNLAYKIYRDAEWTEVKGLTSTQCELTDLMPQKDYVVRVQTVNGDEVSKWRAEDFRTLDKHFMPTDLEVLDVSAHGVMLKWTENDDAIAWEVSLNDNIVKAYTTPCSLSGILMAGTEYNVKVRSYFGEDDYSLWSDEVTFTTLTANKVPEVMAVNPTPNSVNIKWRGNSDSYKLLYKRANVVPTTVFFDSFEDGINGWSVITKGEAPREDGWITSTDNHHSGGCTVCSTSFIYGTPYHADNWLISPKLDLQGTVKFWVASSDMTYLDRFQVLLSTADEINSTDDFTILLRPLQAAPCDWTEVSIDLSRYEGQQGFIAIRHYDYNQYSLYLDDFGIYADDWQTIETTEKEVTIEGLTPDTEYDFKLIGVMEGEESSATEMATFTTFAPNPVPFDIAVNAAATSATINWSGFGQQYLVEYRTVGSEGYEEGFSDDFESGNLDKWTVYTQGTSPTANGWVAEQYNNDAHGGSYMACSKSWVNNIVYNADNWLVTPRLALQGTLTFWVKSADKNYLDSYEVLLSTTGNAVSDFKTTLRPLQEASGNWTQVTINLNKAGQYGYVAIRHHNSDRFRLHVDDFNFDCTAAISTGEWTSGGYTTTPQNTLKGLTPNTTYEFKISSIKSGEPYAISDVMTFTTAKKDPVNINLIDNGSNYGMLSEFNTRCCNATIKNRTLYKDGTWRTLCLPFDVDVDNNVLKGADVRTLESVELRSGVAILNCLTPITQLKAGTPYIIRWDGGETIYDPVFTNVTIDIDSKHSIAVDGVEFIGADYYAKPASSSYPDCYYVPDSPILLLYESDHLIRAFEAYFKMSNEILSKVHSIVLYTGEEDDLITGVSSIDETQEGAVIYNLSGQRLAKKQRGINIVNGKKVLVK